MDDVIIRAIPLPLTVRAFTIPDPQGDYNVYINSLLSEESQKKSLAHEREHIINGDFYKKSTAVEIEAQLQK